MLLIDKKDVKEVVLLLLSFREAKKQFPNKTDNKELVHTVEVLLQRKYAPSRPLFTRYTGWRRGESAQLVLVHLRSRSSVARFIWERRWCKSCGSPSSRALRWRYRWHTPLHHLALPCSTSWNNCTSLSALDPAPTSTSHPLLPRFCTRLCLLLPLPPPPPSLPLCISCGHRLLHHLSLPTYKLPHFPPSLQPQLFRCYLLQI